ncbi:protein spinster homolog 3-like [Ara ararauna]
MHNPRAHESASLQSQPPPEEQNYGATAAHGRQGPVVSVSRKSLAKRDCLIATVLCYTDVINFMGWFLVPGILLDIEKYFKLSDGDTGLLQTAFILCYMLAVPIFRYLGDRYNREFILGAGIFFWSGVTLSRSFISELLEFCLVLAGSGCRGLCDWSPGNVGTAVPLQGSACGGHCVTVPPRDMQFI